jgi:hypothetical protein
MLVMEIMDINLREYLLIIINLHGKKKTNGVLVTLDFVDKLNFTCFYFQ